MKRIVFFLAMVTTSVMVFAQQHVEFKWHGFYSAIDYTIMTNLNKQHGGYNDLSGVFHPYEDSYFLNGITAVAGWQWRKESAVGLGFSYLSDATRSFSQIPVFVEYRSHLTRDRIAPYTAVQIGYSIPFGSVDSNPEFTRIDKGGITAGISLGARYAWRQKIGFNAYIGFQMIHLGAVARGFNEVAATVLPELYHNFKAGLGVNF